MHIIQKKKLTTSLKKTQIFKLLHCVSSKLPDFYTIPE